MHTCRNPWCKSPFEITPDDLAFYEKVSPVFPSTTLGAGNGKKELIPPPTLCTSCGHQRRLAFRNERNLYHRSCGKCGRQTVSVFSPEKPFTVYCPACWWGDDWDALAHGLKYDFSRPFFDQFAELLTHVPLLSNSVFNCTNAEFNSFCVDSKNIYLCTRVGDCEDVCYTYLPLNCIGCMDCYDVFHCQLCYECVDCWTCYNAIACQLCRECNDCSFCHDCIGCRNCIGCSNLRNAEYCIFNEKRSKEEFQKMHAELRSGSAAALQMFNRKFCDFLLRQPKRALVIINAENVSGDYISESKDIEDCFDIEKTETARHSWGVEYSKDVMHSDYIYYGERCYENISNSKSTDIHFCFTAIGAVHDLWYSLFCFNGTHDCFGCAALKHQSYCILNTQYTREEYENILPRIIDHMRSTGEWGEFFPASLSPFAYNESIAQEHFSLTKEEVRKRGWRWRDLTDDTPKGIKTIPASMLPDVLSDTPDDILNWAVTCAETQQPFRIVKQELDFYRRMQLPIPRLHPDERHRRRMALRNPRKLWNRTCQKCGKGIETTYSPERPERVLCEECYLKEVY